MPLYEYQCTGCGAVVTELRGASQREDPVQCPHCGGEAHVMLSTFSTSSGDGVGVVRPGCYRSDDACGPT